MGNFFNNEPKILRLIVRVRIYNYCTSRQKNVDLKTGFLRIEIYRSQTDYTIRSRP